MHQMEFRVKSAGVRFLIKLLLNIITGMIFLVLKEQFVLLISFFLKKKKELKGAR